MGLGFSKTETDTSLSSSLLEPRNPFAGGRRNSTRNSITRGSDSFRSAQFVAARKVDVKKSAIKVLCRSVGLVCFIAFHAPHGCIRPNFAELFTLLCVPVVNRNRAQALCSKHFLCRPLSVTIIGEKVVFRIPASSLTITLSLTLTLTLTLTLKGSEVGFRIPASSGRSATQAVYPVLIIPTCSSHEKNCRCLTCRLSTTPVIKTSQSINQRLISPLIGHSL